MVAIREPLRAVNRIPGVGLVQAVPRTFAFMVGSQVQARRPDRVVRPVAKPSWAMVGQVAMDEAILGAVAAGRFPGEGDLDRVAAEIVEADRMWAGRGWADDPVSYHRAPPVLEWPRVQRRWSLPPMQFEHVSFDSGYEPWPGEPGAERWQSREANHTAHAWVLRHPGPPRPWLVCVHGMGMGNSIVDFPAFRAARLHNQRGLNLCFPILPLHGPRRAGRGDVGGFPTYDPLDAVHGFAQSVWDVRRLVTWIQSQGAPMIGMYGISLGGYVASLLAAHESSFRAVIAGVPVVDLPRLMRHHANGEQRRRGREYHLTDDLADRVYRVVSPLEAPPVVPRDRLAVYGGIGDRVATAHQAQLLWKHWEPCEICWYPGNHVGFFWSGKVDRFVTTTLDRLGFSYAAPLVG